MNLSSLYFVIIALCQTEDAYTGAIAGGVVAVVIVSIITALTVIVVVALLKKRFGNYSTGAQTKYVMIMWNKLVTVHVSEHVYILFFCRHPDSAVDIPAYSNEPYELTKITKAAYEYDLNVK